MLSTLSAAYQKRGQLADAVGAAMDAVDADPSVPALYNNLGVLLASLEQHEAALEHGFVLPCKKQSIRPCYSESTVPSDAGVNTRYQSDA